MAKDTNKSKTTDKEVVIGKKTSKATVAKPVEIKKPVAKKAEVKKPMVKETKAKVIAPKDMQKLFNAGTDSAFTSSEITNPPSIAKKVEVKNSGLSFQTIEAHLNSPLLADKNGPAGNLERSGSGLKFSSLLGIFNSKK